ncbi:MAG TPA: 50S ribosomal protein L40e [Candidatus Nanoarchaeia archaeon]|nr:50S ribosomal protein L40e [Candidatus Nanoarchaeia archaeon]
MAKFEEAIARMFRDVFVCRKCTHKVHAPSMKVSQGLVKCRNCGSRILRPRRRK